MDTLPFTATLVDSNNKLWGHHFVVPQLQVQALTEKGKDRRVVCTLNESAAEWQCALLPVGDGTFVISVNKKIRDKLGLSSGSQFRVSLQKDESEFGLPMPEELEEVLKQDPDGAAVFQKLSPGKQRTLLYIVSQAKNVDKRIAYSMAILDHLQQRMGKIDFKALQIDLQKATQATSSRS